MAQLVRHLAGQRPMLLSYQYSAASAFHLLLSTPLFPEASKHLSHGLLSSAKTTFSVRRDLHSRSRVRRFKPLNAPLQSDSEIQQDATDDTQLKKSRNQLKREARRAVQWATDLASFSPKQIKRILRVVSLDQQVYEALMLVKRLGPDVREGRRRQFNYIGKLLRGVQHELMDRLILATKNSDHQELQALSGAVLEVAEYEEGEEDVEMEKDEAVASNSLFTVSTDYNALATRWFEGLVNKEIGIMNEVYSLQGVEFDRQELRKLVRRVQSAQEQIATDEDQMKADVAISGAKKSLTRFLRALAKQIPSEG